MCRKVVLLGGVTVIVKTRLRGWAYRTRLRNPRAKAIPLTTAITPIVFGLGDREERPKSITRAVRASTGMIAHHLQEQTGLDHFRSESMAS